MTQPKWTPGPWTFLNVYAVIQHVIRTVFAKRSDAIRCVVEDDNGRLFIHSAKNIEKLIE